jgi:hypothetical protein
MKYNFKLTKKYLSDDPFYFFLLLLWLCIITSLNTHGEHFVAPLNFNLSILELLKTILSKLQLLIFFFLTLFFFIRIEIKKFFFQNKIIFLFFILSLLQFVPFFFKKINFGNIIFIIQNLNVILFLSIFLVIYKKKMKEILILSYSVFFLVFIYFLFYYYFTYFTTNHIMYGFYHPKINFLFEYNDPPRSSGLSRLALFLLIFFEFNKFFFKKKIKYFLISIILVPIIILTQSRINIFLLMLFLFYLFFIINNKKFFFLYYIIIPFIFIIILNFLKPSNKIITYSDSKFQYNSIEILNKNIRPLDPESFSSRRFEGWLYIFELKKNNTINNIDAIIGFGPQGDRIFIPYTVSNAALYTFLSCGIFGLSILILIYFNLIILLYKKIKRSYYLLAENEYTKISFFLITFIVLRSLLENSFVIFGIDSIFLLIAIQLFNYDKNKS